MRRELQAPDGGFYSSLSAVDADDVEGGYYLFDAVELERVLDEEERRVAGVAWGLDGNAPFEHGFLPIQSVAAIGEVASAVGLSSEEVAGRLDSARAKLLAARARRELPRDEKRLAGWNGLALSAFVRASLREGGARYEAPTRAIVRFLTDELWDGSTLVRARAPAGSRTTDPTPGTLQDYAYVARGLNAFARAYGSDRDWELARRMVEGAWQRFRASGGWRLSDAPGLPFSGAESAIADGPMPSPSAALLDAAMQVATHFQDDALLARTRAALLADDPGLRPAAFFHATRIRALRRWQLVRASSE